MLYIGDAHALSLVLVMMLLMYLCTKCDRIWRMRCTSWFLGSWWRLLDSSALPREYYGVVARCMTNAESAGTGVNLINPWGARKSSA